MVAADLTLLEEAGVEALLVEERGLANLSNRQAPLRTGAAKNAARIQAGRRVLENARRPKSFFPFVLPPKKQDDEK